MAKNEINRQFLLLKNIIRYSETAEMSVDISAAEQMILHTLPEELEKNAPPNFPELYFDFKQEYERFKDFILYDKLIGKNTVALGGGFSSGKSSFLNSLLSVEILPSDISPSTSVPTYLVYGDNDEVYGINTFDSKVKMDIEDVMLLAHGFGREGGEQEVTLGHLLSNLFISTPKQVFENLVLLDTPGYSKAETVGYSAKTDEKIARTQLNSSNYILWFVQADAGTITDSDIEFIKTLNPEIPKLIIVNKADKIPPSELEDVVGKIRNVLDIKGIRYVDVLTYSSEEPEDYQLDEITEYLHKWDSERSESRFAYNFKVLFTKCREYYDERLADEQKLHSRLSHILADVSLENDDARDYLNSLDSASKKRISELKDLKERLKSLQNDFFTEMKRIGDAVNIVMPEPSEIDLIRDKAADPKEILDAYCEKAGKNTQKALNARKDLADMISGIFEDIEPVFNKLAGTTDYTSELADEIEGLLKIDKIKFNNMLIK